MCVRAAAAALFAATALATGCSTEAREVAPGSSSAAASAPVTVADPAGLFEAGPTALADETVVGPPYYPEAESLPPAGEPRRSPDELLLELQALVGARSASLAAEARQLFSDAQVRRRVPAPELRAAVAGLLGTIAEPAVDWLVRDGPFVRIAFGDPPGNAIARSLAQPDGSQRIVVDRAFRFERPALLSIILAHEAFHADGRASDLEELIATSFQALVHVEQILADPTLTNERTALSQATNAWVVIRLNTRTVGSSDLRLVLGDSGRTVLPGGLDRPHFAAFFDPSAEPTPGNPYLQALVAAVAQPGSAEPALPDFDLETVAFLDTNQAVLSVGELLDVARALGLRVESVA